MTDVTIILPLHTIEGVNEDIEGALRSVEDNRKSYKHGKLELMVVCPSNISVETKQLLECCGATNFTIIENNGATDYCSQVNLAVSKLETEYFSILEYDDEYTPQWFNMWHEYLYSREDVSVFLPINRQINVETQNWQYCNELVWASSFSNELGYIDNECLLNTSVFNLTGCVINTEDFKTIGGYKPNIEIAFNYEFLLRATNKKLKVFVVPKEGYYHAIGRKGSLTDRYLSTMTHEDIKKCFERAYAEHAQIEGDVK